MPVLLDSTAGSTVPLWAKLGFTAFMAVLLPVYTAQYGWTNFLYVCDVAMILTLIGVWTGHPLTFSTALVGIGALQALWVVDFLANLVGVSLTGITDYMFDPSKPAYLRGLSFFHFWLPFFLVFLVWRTGYDKRAVVVWSALAAVLALVCFFLMPPPQPNPGLTPVNINYVWGPSDHQAQTWVPPGVWLAGLIFGLPLLVYGPTHLILRWLAPQLSRASPRPSPRAGRRRPRPG